MKYCDKIAFAVEEYRVSTGLKPNAIVLSSWFLKQTTDEIQKHTTIDLEGTKEHRFQGIEVLESKDTVNHITVI
jgi:hypothetical protein